MLTEYASERRHQGMSITQAAVSAAEVRLRPILMTSLTMIFGMLPLMFASGVGANREYFYRCRDSRRYVDRYYSLVVYRTGFVYRVPISARENYASA